jgi:hypothetical protein
MRTTAWLVSALLLASTAGVHAQGHRAASPADQPSAGGAKDEKVGVDREAAICHALCMAIEGSELSCCALQCSKTSAGRGNGGGGTASAMALEQHARDAFQASMHLFDSVQADKTDNPNPRSANCEEFYQAAKRYGQALERCCRNAGTDEAPRAAANPAVGKSSMDPAQMTLLNHAVKEAVEAVGLRKLIRHHHDRSEIASALDDHAKQMLESSAEALHSVSGTSAASKAARRSDANLPKRDSAIAPTSGDAGVQRAAEPSGESLPALAVALIDAVKRLDR